MSYLDTAAKTADSSSAGDHTAHFLSAIAATITVQSTSIGLDPGDRVDGPPHGQLLVVVETHSEGAAPERTNAATVDLVCRELLRDDHWLNDLRASHADSAAIALETAFKVASTSLAATLGSGAGDEGSHVAVTAALVAWPYVAAARSGDGAAVCLNGSRPLDLLLPNGNERNAGSGLGGAGAPKIDSWAGELEQTATLILGTGMAYQHGLKSLDQDTNRLDTRCSADELTDKLMARIRDANPESRASIAVAKLSDGDVGLLETARDEESLPPSQSEQDLPLEATLASSSEVQL